MKWQSYNASTNLRSSLIHRQKKRLLRKVRSPRISKRRLVLPRSVGKRVCRLLEYPRFQRAILFVVLP